MTPEERLFLKLISKGTKRSKAFRLAFPEHPTVQRYMDAVKTDDKDLRRTTSNQVADLARSRLETQHMQNAMTVYQEKMDEFSDAALDTALDLVKNARSEKVRADLAIEGMRHKIGTPVQKMQVQRDENIVITFGDRHPDDVIDVDAIEEADII